MYHILDLADADFMDFIDTCCSLNCYSVNRYLLFPQQSNCFFSKKSSTKIVPFCGNQHNLVKLNLGRLSQVRLITIVWIEVDFAVFTSF